MFLVGTLKILNLYFYAIYHYFYAICMILDFRWPIVLADFIAGRSRLCQTQRPDGWIISYTKTYCVRLFLTILPEVSIT